MTKRNAIEELKARIAARKASGLTAEEYNRREAAAKQDAKRGLRMAIRNCLTAGLAGSEAYIDTAIEKYHAAKRHVDQHS